MKEKDKKSRDTLKKAKEHCKICMLNSRCSKKDQIDRIVTIAGMIGGIIKVFLMD